MKILLTGGGTAGHVTPHVALLPELRKLFSKIYYVGTNGIEKSIISKYDYVKFYEIKAVKLIRSFNFKNFLIPFKLINAVKTCKKILKEIKPNIIFSKGGFVSVPVVIAAKSLKIPVISHESDKSLGLANKIILKFCKIMCTSFLPPSNNKKFVHTGSPVRENLHHGDSQKVFEQAHFQKSKTNILFIGGSLGAKAINDVVFSCLPQLCKKYNVVHIVGKNNSKHFTIPNYLQLQYTDSIEDYFAFADIVISRSGANTIFELLELKKPMLLIPLPKTQSRGDQLDNADEFHGRGFAEVLQQEYLTPETILKNIDLLDRNKKTYIETMNNLQTKNANKCVLDIILENVNKN